RRLHSKALMSLLREGAHAFCRDGTLTPDRSTRIHNQEIMTQMRTPIGTAAISLGLVAMTSLSVGALTPADGARPPYDPRAVALVAKMTPDERITLLHGYWSRPDRTGKPLLPGANPGAGHTPAIPRLGIPALQESDASLGVSWIGGQRVKGGTALPSG